MLLGLKGKTSISQFSSPTSAHAVFAPAPYDAPPLVRTMPLCTKAMEQRANTVFAAIVSRALKNDPFRNRGLFSTMLSPLSSSFSHTPSLWSFVCPYCSPPLCLSRAVSPSVARCIYLYILDLCLPTSRSLSSLAHVSLVSHVFIFSPSPSRFLPSFPSYLPL